MKNGRSRLPSRQRVKYVISDFMTTSVAFLLFNIYRFHYFGNYTQAMDYIFSSKLVVEEVTVPLVMLGVYWLSGYYNNPFGKSRLQELLTTFFSALINSALVYLVLLINDQTGERRLNYEMLIVLTGLLFILPYLGRLTLTDLARNHFRTHRWQFNCLVVGNSAKSRETAGMLLGSGRVDYRIIGFVEIPGEHRIEDGETLYNLSELRSVCETMDIDQVVIAMERYDDDKVMNILRELYTLEIPVKIAPDTLSYVTSAIRLKDIYGEPFVDLTVPMMSESSKNVKRLFDVVASVMVILLLSPLYIAIGLLVRLDSAGGVLYSQERIGRRQRPFRIYKFRTMKADAESGVPMLSNDSDTRITRVGRVLRKYRLDELPQFWNVIKGDMSIVGPRPERAYFIRQIVEKAPYYTLVYQVRPGITSWGMVKFGYASNLEEMIERTRYDLIYMANMSLLVDMKILIYTVRTVIKGKGI
ncbi:MAG: sugar transferase [Muribaculaceae bacterium]|nr:sugar transferase [Muribaculaceae bacterium]